MKNKILNNYIHSVYSTLSFQLIFGKLIVNRNIGQNWVNETITYLYSQIISIELKMIFLNFSPLDWVMKYQKSDLKCLIKHFWGTYMKNLFEELHIKTKIWRDPESPIIKMAWLGVIGEGPTAQNVVFC